MKFDKDSSIEEMLSQLHEIGFKINDMKEMNQDNISLDAYESLLNYSIDFVTAINDAVVASK